MQHLLQGLVCKMHDLSTNTTNNIFIASPIPVSQLAHDKMQINFSATMIFFSFSTIQNAAMNETSKSKWAKEMEVALAITSATLNDSCTLFPLECLRQPKIWKVQLHRLMRLILIRSIYCVSHFDRCAASNLVAEVINVSR